MRRASKGYSGVITPLFDIMLVRPQDKAPSTSPSRITSSPSLSSHHTTSSTPTTPPSIQTTHEAEETATMPYDSPLLGGHTSRSDEGRLKHNELMELVTKLSDRVVVVEEDLKQTKKAYSIAFTKLVLKVKKLEQQVRSGKARRRARIDERALWFQEDVETQEKNNVDTKVLLEEETPTKLIEDLRNGEKDEELARKVQEEEQAKAMAEQEQERINFEAALELQRQLNEREEVPAKATQSQTIDWSDPDVLRYHALQNRPYSVAKVRKNMVMYLKNQAGYKQSFFKGMKYDEIRPIFEKVWDQTHTFIPMDSEDKEKGTKKKSGGTRKKTLAKKRAGEEFAMDFESLATKFPIVDWKTYVLAENFMYYQIFRADGSSKNYKIFSEMLDDFDRHDVLDLHRLVKARYMTSSLEGYDLMLWGDLKTLFEPDEEDEVWKNQHEYNLISWRLFDSCGIHILLMNNGIAIHMMTEKKYPLNQEMLSRVLSKRLEVDHESTMAYELLKFIKS
ncbi:hypothetical protein Tco_0675571 [Tanacetum coccineum]